MTFHVGQKVVCVDASPARYDVEIKLAQGRIYTVSGFDPESSDGVYLSEVPFGKIAPPWKFPRGWSADRFRPIVERSTDIGFAHDLSLAALGARLAFFHSSGDGLGNHQPGSMTCGFAIMRQPASGRARDRAICPAVARSDWRAA